MIGIYKITKEFKELQRTLSTGRKHSEESKAKMVQIKKEYWINKKRLQNG